MRNIILLKYYQSIKQITFKFKIMTPKEKAIELVEKYFINVEIFIKQDSIPSILKAPMTKKSVKQCALIAVDEILNIKSVDKDYDLSNYWEEVKQEIENL